MTPSEFSDYVISVVEEVANLHWVVSSCKREEEDCKKGIGTADRTKSI